MGKSKPRVFRSIIKARHSTFYNVRPIFYRTPIIFITFACMNKTRLFTAISTIAFATATICVSCHHKPETQNIIAKKPQKTVKKEVMKVGDYSQSREVQWLGSTYQVSVQRKADTSLAIVKDENGNRYYDNAITVDIKRGDGTSFFHRTFTKADFADCTEDSEAGGALLGIVFDKAEGKTLRFAASVGSPDKMSDEYVPLVVNISNMGQVTIKKDTQLDTGSDQPEDDANGSEDDI